MILSIALGLISSALAYKVYSNEKKSQDFLHEFDRLNRFNKQLEDDIWNLRIELQDANNQILLAKMSHEKTKQELEDKAKTWENQYNNAKNESKSN
jgi:predicted  nucleic acid-binding Zn-ribbon protein